MANFWLWLKVGWAALTSRSNRVFYDRVAPIYDKVYLSHHVHATTIADLLSARHAGREQETLVLDLGCGTGTLARMLAERGFRVIGVDPSFESLRIQIARNFRSDLVQADAEQLPVAGGCLQSVVCLGVWRHFPDPQRVLDEICRVLEADGELFISYFPPAIAGALHVGGGRFGRFLTWIYERLIKLWGYTDRADVDLEKETVAAARRCFREVRTMASGSRWRMIWARGLIPASAR